MAALRKKLLYFDIWSNKPNFLWIFNAILKFIFKSEDTIELYFTN